MKTRIIAALLGLAAVVAGFHVAESGGPQLPAVSSMTASARKASVLPKGMLVRDSDTVHHYASVGDGSTKGGTRLRGYSPEVDRMGNLFGGLRVASTRTRAVFARDSAANSQSDGTHLVMSSKVLHYIPDDAYGIRLVHGDTAWWNTLATNYPITVTSSIVVQGVIYQMTWNGATSVAIQPLTYVISDPLGPWVAAGTSLEVRTCVTIASGAKFPTGYPTSTGDAYVFDSDVTMSSSPSWVSITGARLPGCSAIIGRVPNPSKPSILMDGDSIMQGYGDSEQQFPLDQGWLAKALNNQYSYIQASLYGDSAFNFRTPWSKDRMKFVGTCDYVVCGMGSNDLYVSPQQTLAQLQASLLARWKFHSMMSSRVIQTTITPRTTSTDGWATTANQTISNPAQNTVRIAFNNWLRAGAPIVNGAAVAVGTDGAILAGQYGHPLHDYLELADIVESARDSGILTVAYGPPTTDGTHFSAVLTTGAANGIRADLQAKTPGY